MSEVLNVSDHARDSAGLTYVYPVVSRRAGGVSVGINLNPNNACNWRCLYCQVPTLKRGAAPVVDLDKLGTELRGFLGELLRGNFMAKRVPAEARRLNDIALSGNGEPTSAKDFDRVVALIGEVMAEFDLVGRIKLVLITNGSLINRPAVQAALRRMAALNGEVWFKLDSGTAAGLLRINGTRQSMAKVRDNLRTAASLCPTWLQTCLFALDGVPLPERERTGYLELLRGMLAEGVKLQGVLLYGLARLPLQPGAERLSQVPRDWAAAFAADIEALGLPVKSSL